MPPAPIRATILLCLLLNFFKGDLIKEEIELKAVIDNYSLFMDFLESNLDRLGLDKESILNLLTAAEEIIVNVIKYAYKEEPGELKIAFDYSPGTITLLFTDGGTPFNPLDRPEVDTTLSLDERKEGGLGILMAKTMTDEMLYEYKNSKNCLTLVKHISLS